MCLTVVKASSTQQGLFFSSPVFNCGSAEEWPLVLVKLWVILLPFPSCLQGSDYLLPLNVAGAVGVRSSVLRQPLQLHGGKIFDFHLLRSGLRFSK